MKSFKLLILSLIIACLPLGLALTNTGCKSTLESGGAYAPTGQLPDKAFFIVDAAYQVGYQTIDAAFQFERNNRALLWKASPQIKHTLDDIRPQAAAANKEYLTARAVYMANPTPSGLTTLQTVLAKIQQLVVTATSVLPK